MLLQAGAFATVAGVSFILFTVVYILGCCCCSGKVSGKAASCRGLGCAGGVYLFTSALLLASSLTAVLYTVKFDDGGSTFLGAFEQLTGLLVNTTNLLPPLIASSASLSSTAALTYTEAQALGASQSILNGILDIQNDATGVAQGTATLYSSLNDTISSLQSGLRTEGDGDVFHPSTPSNDINAGSVDRGAFRLAIGIAGVALTWAVFSACVLAPNRVSACLFKATSCLSILITTLFLLATGVLYALALFGSDICIDPAGSLITVLNATSADVVATESVRYYSTCAVLNPPVPVPPMGLLAQAISVRDGFQAAVIAINAFNASVSADPSLQPLLPLVVDVSNNASVAVVASQAITDGIACTPVANVWNTFTAALCQRFVLSIAQTFLCFCGASAMMLVMLCAGARINCAHPGSAGGPSREQQYQTAMDDLRAARVAQLSTVPPAYYGSASKVSTGQPVTFAPAAATGAKAWK